MLEAALGIASLFATIGALWALATGNDHRSGCRWPTLLIRYGYGAVACAGLLALQLVLHPTPRPYGVVLLLQTTGVAMVLGGIHLRRHWPAIMKRIGYVDL